MNGSYKLPRRGGLRAEARRERHRQASRVVAARSDTSPEPMEPRMKAKTPKPSKAVAKVTPLTDKDRLDLFRMMVRIREFEEEVQRSYLEGLVHGTTHLCQGQEAVSAGTGIVFREDDYIGYTYRGHGVCIARGMDAEAAFAELFGRTIGCLRRRRRLDAPHRHRQGPDRRLRHRRRRPAGLGRRRRHRPAQRPRPALGDLLRRRRDQYRRLPRVDEHRPGLEAAGPLHLREQPLRRVHPHQPLNALRGPDQAGQGLRDAGGAGRRQRRRGGLSKPPPRRRTAPVPVAGRPSSNA